MTAPAETRYVFDDVDQEAVTKPGAEPVQLFPTRPPLSALAPPKPIRVDQALASLWTPAEVRQLLTLVALLCSAVVIGFHLAHFWVIGGWIGVRSTLEQIIPGVVFGGALTWMAKR